MNSSETTPHQQDKAVKLDEIPFSQSTQSNNSKVQTVQQPSKHSQDDFQTLKLIQELENSQLELEKQNTQLQLADEKTRILSRKYLALYDFAPMGYYTIDHDGKICELNICGALLLGRERFSLVGCNFWQFISWNSLPVFNAFLKKADETKVNQSCEVKLLLEGSSSNLVHMEGFATKNNQKYIIAAVEIARPKM